MPDARDELSQAQYVERIALAKQHLRDLGITSLVALQARHTHQRMQLLEVHSEELTALHELLEWGR